MVPFLAYRLQEKAYGGLKPATRSKLLRIARALEKSSFQKSIDPAARNQTWNAHFSPVARRITRGSGNGIRLRIPGSQI